MQRQIPIERCEVCAEIADKALDGGADEFRNAASSFLTHVVEIHPSELLGLLAERYGPIFLAKRQMR